VRLTAQGLLHRLAGHEGTYAVSLTAPDSYLQQSLDATRPKRTHLSCEESSHPGRAPSPSERPVAHERVSDIWMAAAAGAGAGAGRALSHGRDCALPHDLRDRRVAKGIADSESPRGSKQSCAMALRGTGS